MRIAIVSGSSSATDEQLVALRARGVEIVSWRPPTLQGHSPTDVALGRIDVPISRSGGWRVVAPTPASLYFRHDVGRRCQMKTGAIGEGASPAGGNYDGRRRAAAYDLRHSFVSLLLAERRSLLDVAKQAGHSPTMALNTYGHVIEELEGAVTVSAEDAIRRARAKFVRTTFARRSKGRERRTKKNPGKRGKPSDGLEPSTPSLPCAPIGDWSQPVAMVLPD
jgi:hypothetical protein